MPYAESNLIHVLSVTKARRSRVNFFNGMSDIKLLRPKSSVSMFFLQTAQCCLELGEFQNIEKTQELAVVQAQNLKELPIRPQNLSKYARINYKV